MSVLDDIAEATALVKRERHRAEQAYGITSSVMERLGPLGVFRLLARDRRIGLGEYLRVVEALAYADPSVAWAAVNSNGAAMATYVYPDELASEMLEEGNWFFGVGFPPTGKAERVDGVLEISGRWPVVSGCGHAAHFVLNCVVHSEGEVVMSGPMPEMGFVAVPRSAVRIERTWDGVNAVKGSGSHAVSVEGHRASAASIATMAAMLSAPTPMAQLPGLSSQSISLAAVAIGIGRAAVEGAIEQASNRVSAASGRGWADYPSTQNSVASADMAVESARQGLFSVADSAGSQIESGHQLDAVTNARLHSVCDHAFRVVRQSVSDLFAAGSVDALRSGHILEQSLRDIHGFSVHWERYRHLHYLAGNGLLGGEITDPLY